MLKKFKVLCVRMLPLNMHFYHYLQMPGPFRSHHLSFQVLVPDWLDGEGAYSILLRTCAQ